jgi:hypothetical protein
MNAYELANELGKQTGGAGNIYQQAAIMLKQLQDDLSDLQRHIPVKKLTDEEINAEMLAYLNSKTMGLEDFARAILRKAQE